MTSDKEISVDLVNGPAKFDLMLAMFKKGEKATFTLNGGQKITVQLLAVEKEDGSCESWIIKGFITDGSKFEGYYSTRKNEGFVKIAL